MAFTVRDYHDLVTLLGQRPEWRSELRQLLLTDEILGLPQAVRELTEAQKRAEVRLEGIEARLERVEARLEGVEARLERIEKIVENLAEAQYRFETKLGRLEGWELEHRYRDRPYSYFGHRVRKLHAVPVIDVPAVEEAYDNGQISDADWQQLLALDVLARGTVQGRETYLAVEVSVMLDNRDIERARQRADILRRLGLTVIGVAGGSGILPGVDELAHQLGVAVALDGSILHWPVDDASA